MRKILEFISKHSQNLRELLKAISFPLVVLIFLVGFFYYVSGDIFKSGLLGSFAGSLVGIVLGFIAEMLRENIKDFQRDMKEKKVFKKLLEEDAKSVHHSMWLYSGLIRSANVPEDIKASIPAPFELRYWDILSKDKYFLSLGEEEPFKSIFREMWELEKVNLQINDAKLGRPQAYQFAVGIYRVMMDDETTKKLLLKFVSEKEIFKLERKWLSSAKQNKK